MIRIDRLNTRYARYICVTVSIFLRGREVDEIVRFDGFGIPSRASITGVAKGSGIENRDYTDVSDQIQFKSNSSLIIVHEFQSRAH